MKSKSVFQKIGLVQTGKEKTLCGAVSRCPAPKGEMLGPGYLQVMSREERQWFLSASIAASTDHYQTGYGRGNFSLAVI